MRLVLIYRSCHVVTRSTLKTKQRHTKNVRVIEVNLMNNQQFGSRQAG